MKLAENWTLILKHAWSMRLMLLAGLLTAAETILPAYFDGLPRDAYNLLTATLIGAGMVARLVAQSSVTPPGDAKPANPANEGQGQ